MHHTISQFVRTPPAVSSRPGISCNMWLPYHVAFPTRPASLALFFLGGCELAHVAVEVLVPQARPACRACPHTPGRLNSQQISPFLELAHKTAISGSLEALLLRCCISSQPFAALAALAPHEAVRLFRKDDVVRCPLCPREHRSGPDAVGESAACMPKLEPTLAGGSESCLRGPLNRQQGPRPWHAVARVAGLIPPVSASTSAQPRSEWEFAFRRSSNQAEIARRRSSLLLPYVPEILLLDRTAVVQTQWSAAACNNYLPRFQHAMHRAAAQYPVSWHRSGSDLGRPQPPTRTTQGFQGSFAGRDPGSRAPFSW